MFFLLFISTRLFAQTPEILQIDSLPKSGILLDKGWKYKVGDDLTWAKVDFDDASWASIDPNQELSKLPDIRNTQVKWLRIDFEIKKAFPKPLGIAINQAGATEIYLNGQLIHELGQFDTDPTKVKAFDPLEQAIYLPADTIGKYTLAVRYALQPNIRYTNIFGLTKNRLFQAAIVALVPTLTAQRAFRVYYTGIEIFIIGIVFMLFILHGSHYFYQRSNRGHLFLMIYFFGLIIIRIFVHI